MSSEDASVRFTPLVILDFKFHVYIYFTLIQSPSQSPSPCNDIISATCQLELLATTTSGTSHLPISDSDPDDDCTEVDPLQPLPKKAKKKSTRILLDDSDTDESTTSVADPPQPPNKKVKTKCAQNNV